MLTYGASEASAGGRHGCAVLPVLAQRRYTTQATTCFSSDTTGGSERTSRSFGRCWSTTVALTPGLPWPTFAATRTPSRGRGDGGLAVSVAGLDGLVRLGSHHPSDGHQNRSAATPSTGPHSAPSRPTGNACARGDLARRPATNHPITPTPLPTPPRPRWVAPHMAETGDLAGHAAAAGRGPGSF
jgi:hypothetical protein